MTGHRKPPVPSGGEQLLRQLVETLPAPGPPALRPVALRSVALQRQETLSGYALRNWIDVALVQGERLLVAIIVVVAGLWAVNGPLYDWRHSHRVSRGQIASVQVVQAAAMPARVKAAQVMATVAPVQAAQVAAASAPALPTTSSAGAGPVRRVVIPMRARHPELEGTRRDEIGRARHPELGAALPSSGQSIPRPAVVVDYLAPARGYLPPAPLRRESMALSEPVIVSEPVAAPTPKQEVAAAPPPPRDMRPTRLQAPAAGLDTPVAEVLLEDGVWQVADYAAGYHHGTGVPGAGNVVMAGHKGVRGAVFARLEALKPGDDVFVDAAGQRYRYLVRETRNVWPSEVEVMFPTRTPTLTLLTCTNWDLQRFVVIADLVDSAPLPMNAGG